MAECNKLFSQFIEKIKLDNSKKSSLESSRKGIREKIENYFSNELKVAKPTFFSQGSFALKTVVNPINGEYDIDDGVYIQHLDNEDSTKWESVETVHNWIYDAVKNHTKTPPRHKKPCIRVIYAGEYHADLPVYCELNDVIHLAHTEKRWHPNDPKILTKWFQDKFKNSGEQVRTNIILLKAWADNNSKLCEMPAGIILSILVCENYKSSKCDDTSFANTVKNISQKISSEFKIVNPINDKEILTDKLTASQKSNFVSLITTLSNDADKAIEEATSLKDACKLWKNQFGDRFPACDDDDKKTYRPIRTSAPAILRDDTRSA